MHNIIEFCYFNNVAISNDFNIILNMQNRNYTINVN